MKKKTLTKVLSMIVVLTLLVGILPVNAWAADHVHDETCGYAEPSACTHAHDDNCGYVAAVEGVDCGHSHDAACGYSEGSAGTPCGHVHGDCGYAEAVPGTPCTHDCASGGCTLNEDGVTYTCAHTHGDCGYSEGTPASACSHTQHTDCGYAAEVPGTACSHTHDDNCGYVEAVSGNPCNHAHNDACGYSEGSDCNYVAPSTEEPEHTCSYDAYSSDEEGHWQVCTDTACAALTAKEGHTFTDDADTDCDTCGYTRIIEPAEKEETEVPVCTCGTDDEAIHATTCPLYVRPEEPRCYCAEQCTEPNVWCDVCGFDVTACEGDPAEVPTPNVTTVDGVITLTPSDLVDGASGEGWSFFGGTLTINSDYTLVFNGECSCLVLNFGTIAGGTFSGEVDNHGTIESGTFDNEVFNRNIISCGTFTKQVTNDGTIVGGTFDCNVANSDSGAIKGGNFNLSCIVENRGTIEGGIFSGSVSNYNGSTISGGVLTGGLGNYGTVTGTADLSNLYDLRDNGGLYGKDVKLPKAEIKCTLTYTGCESSTEITLHYYADGVKTDEWKVSGEKYSYPVEKYKRTAPDADLSAIEGITHKVEAAPMDGYEITVENPIWDRFHVTVSRTTPELVGTDKTITYDGSTYDVSQMFNIDTNAGAASYAIVGGTGSGTLDGSVLTITGAGTIRIKLTTAANGTYAAGEATATLTVKKGNYGVSVSIEGWTYGDRPNDPTSDGPGEVTYTYDNETGAYGGAEPPTDARMWVVVATYTGNDLYNGSYAYTWFTIAKKELTPIISGSVSKNYDGTTAVPADHDLSIMLDGIILGDDISVTATYAYESAEVGTTKIIASDITLGGEDGKNYTVAAVATADVGEILHSHSYGTEWKSDGSNHWHECSCGAKKDVAAHSGGKATCTEKAKCSICGNSYGEKDSNNHSFIKYVSDKNATCKKNGTETAKCDHGCGKTHTRTDWGSKLGHNFVNGVCTRCRLSQWNPDTGDKIMIAVTTLALSGAALLLLLVLRKKQRR